MICPCLKTKCTLYTTPQDLTEEPETSCTLMYMLNDLFTSKNLAKVLEFYDHFPDANRLIQWMEDRPAGRSVISEIPGEDAVVVVVPTSDSDGVHALNCKNSVFPRLRVVFVESGYPSDPFFNFAHNVNLGLRKALEYNPKWVIYSNDDVYKIDDISVLINQLNELDAESNNVALTSSGSYHSIRHSLAKVTSGYFKFFRLYSKIMRKNKEGIPLMMKKYDCRYVSLEHRGFINSVIRVFFTRVLVEYTLTSSFCIFSGKYLEKSNGAVFDETYINGVEDWDLSLRLDSDPEKIAIVDFKIGDYIGSTAGRGPERYLRDVANCAYLSRKLENGDLTIETL